MFDEAKQYWEQKQRSIIHNSLCAWKHTLHYKKWRKTC